MYINMYKNMYKNTYSTSLWVGTENQHFIISIIQSRQSRYYTWLPLLVERSIYFSRLRLWPGQRLPFLPMPLLFHDHVLFCNMIVLLGPAWMMKFWHKMNFAPHRIWQVLLCNLHQIYAMWTNVLRIEKWLDVEKIHTRDRPNVQKFNSSKFVTEAVDFFYCTKQ